ncbi:predicted protein [Botrytis cinerea T4]|uniref:Uncharacterized protein n=1 Tax=Botryotinia fuckeliana (strain T4) TaxID=999810 RepID=G2YNA6_BOTF4|nr:predicted protein [Botrytis cinerea T4]
MSDRFSIRDKGLRQLNPWPSSRAGPGSPRLSKCVPVT